MTEERAQYWEFTDRGVNFSYLPPAAARAPGALLLLVPALARAAARRVRARLRRRPRSTTRGPSPTGPPTAPTPAAGAGRRSRRSLPRTWTRSRSRGSIAPATSSTARASLGKSSLQVTPIAVDGGLYACTPRGRVFALDPETGRERWRYDPGVDASRFYIVNCRGVSTWLDSAAPEGASCRRRILVGTLDARLIALDAATGAPCADFGAGGSGRPRRRHRRPRARRVRRDLAARA